MQKLPTKEALKFGLENVRNNLGFFIGLYFVVALIRFSQGLISSFIQTQSLALAGVINILTWFLQILTSIGIINIAITLYSTNKADFNGLFSESKLFLKYFAAFLLHTLMITLGFILLVIPGVFLLVRLQFWPYIIIEQKVGPIEAFKRSWNLTKNRFFTLFIFGLLLGLINLLGAIVLLVGLFFTLPLTLMAFVYIYKQLISAPQPKPQPVQAQTAQPTPAQNTNLTSNQTQQVK